jgi:hypothetical protein
MFSVLISDYEVTPNNAATFASLGGVEPPLSESKSDVIPVDQRLIHIEKKLFREDKP